MSSDRFSRQSFLGITGQATIQNCVVGIVGLGGGGSHIVQQLAYVGVSHFEIYDGDFVSDSNLNRLVVANAADIATRALKTDVAKRRILEVQPDGRVDAFSCRWQERPEPLRGCDIVFGCVDSFSERRELESLCRQYLIPYIDIGMDIHEVENEAPIMGGQVILSMPGQPCMQCLGFLSEANLAREAANYGAAGGRPQVVWPNGVLASTAVGIAIDLLTGWTQTDSGVVYLSYRGNDGTLTPHVRLNYLMDRSCSHYHLDQVGQPVFKKL